MIKRKELKPSDETMETIQQKGRMENIEDDDDVIDLEDVVEEPDLLPVGEDLDDLLKDEAIHDDFDFDIEKLDSELSAEEEEEIPDDVPPIKPKTSKGVSPVSSPSSVPSAQEAIDELFQEALLEAETPSDSSEDTEIKLETDKTIKAPIVEGVEAELSSVPSEDVEYIIDELEKRLMEKFEAFFQQRLQLIVLETVRQELKALLKELEEQ